jgi:glutamine synthetase
LHADPVMCSAFGPAFINYFCQIKRQEIARYDAAQDKLDWQRREVFARY